MERVVMTNIDQAAENGSRRRGALWAAGSSGPAASSQPLSAAFGRLSRGPVGLAAAGLMMAPWRTADWPVAQEVAP